MNISAKSTRRPTQGPGVLVVLMLVSLLGAATGRAQTNDLTVERIALEQGLSQTTVYCIVQDSRGFMWFGTRDGLNKYDGYGFTVYKHRPENPHSLSNNSVRALYEDSAGVLWVGTDGGLNKFDREKETFTPYLADAGDAASLSHNRIRTLLADQAGRLWIGTYGGGLNRLVPAETPAAAPTFVRYQHDPANPASLSHNSVYALAQDRAGMLWVGTVGGGLNRLDPETGMFVRYQHDPANPASLSHNTVNTVYEDRAGVLWIGTRGGGLDRLAPPPQASGPRYAAAFVHYRHDPANPASLSDDNVNVIVEDRQGGLWIGTYGSGLSKMMPDATFMAYRHDPHDAQSLSHDLIRSMYEDLSGVLWVGTSEGGLNKIDGTKRKFAHYWHDPANPKSLSAPSVSALYEDQAGRLWVGVYGGGLNRRDREAGSFTHYRHDPANPEGLSHDVVYSLYQDRTGTLWVGTIGGGLNALDLSDPDDQGTPAFVHYQHDPNNLHSLSNDRVMAFYEDPDEAGRVLWVGTFGGLNRLDRATGRFTRYLHDPQDAASLSHDHVNVLYQEGEGGLWVGTRGGGLNRFDRATGTSIRYVHDPDDPHSLSHDDVNALYRSPEDPDVLWVGTGGGLDKLDLSAARFVHYREEEGMPNDAVLGILEDKNGHLWLSTYRGLSRFDPRTETFKNYDSYDGLQSNEFNAGAYHQSKAGTMFFGGINGFNAFDPEKITDDPQVPPLVFTDFQLFNEPVLIEKAFSPGGATRGGRVGLRLGKHITETTALVLPYTARVFSFEFAALHYSVPAKNQYAYKMEGFDADWVQAGTRRFATYTNLDPGDYVFRVKGANRDGVWNEEGAAMRITIRPPWWRTTWAYAFYGLLLLAGIVALDRFQRRRLIRQEREKSLLREKELRAEAAEAMANYLQSENMRQTQELDAAHEIEKAYLKLDESHRHLQATQAQLVQQEKLASLGQLTAGIAHEIKNPLNFINNFAELTGELVDDLADELATYDQEGPEGVTRMVKEIMTDLKMNCRKIQEHGWRADGIIRSMLDHARTQPDEHRATDLNALLEQYLTRTYHGMCARHADFAVTLERQYDEALGLVEAAPQEIGRVLFNLVGNAFEAVHAYALSQDHPYAPTVTVSTRRTDQGVEIRIRDNGPGIEAAMREKIFEPFFTTKPPGSGNTGLGLSLAHEIVVQGHGGTLSAASTEGQGATFVLTLPVPPCSDAALSSLPRRSASTAVARQNR